MIIARKITAAVMTFAMVAGCVDADQQGKADVTESGSQLSPIILQADGVAQGESMDFPYGTEKLQVITMLELFGPVSENTNEECGAGPMDFLSSSATGLTLNFQEGQLVGWFFDGHGKSTRTAQDISVGSTRAALEVAMPIELQTDSTLGIEFFSDFGDDGFIGGFLTGEGEGATVESLYAGTNCFFR